MDSSLQYAVAGVATALQLQPTSAFFATPAISPLSPSTPGENSARAGQRLPSRCRSLISSWLAGGRDKHSVNATHIETQTLHERLEVFENSRQYVAQGAAGLAGLLCLERPIPTEVLRGLGYLAGVAAPFKIEALRVGEDPGVDGDDECWSHILTAKFENIQCSDSAGNSEGVDLDGIAAEAEEQLFLTTSEGGRSERGPSVTRITVARDQKLTAAQQQQEQRQLANEAQEAARWLKTDIEHLASLFARQALALAAAKSPSREGPTLLDTRRQLPREEAVTVKLELLDKGKCPRYHLDKVPIRLICTYVGPSTEWLDAYDKWEMINNRRPPPACNIKISAGREPRSAGPGDVLIFRGQPEEGLVQGSALAVAHRSPDTLDGQRRLVLTMDVGDVRASAASAPTTGIAVDPLASP